MSLSERVAALEASHENFTGWMEAHEKRCEKEHAEVRVRLGRIERTMWLATGMLIAAQGIFMVFFLNSVKQLLGLS